MKLYKLSFLALAMAGVLAACSDDDTYTEGPQSPGAYFASTSPTVINLSDDATSVNIPVRRTSASATATTAISVSGDTELFTFPSSVTFSGDELSSNIAVGYTASELEYDKLYNIEITVAEDSQYGMATYKFAFKRPSPIVEEVLYKFNPDKMGNGLGADYTYTVFFGGTDPDLGIIRSYSLNDPSQIIYTIAPWGSWDSDTWESEEDWRNDNPLSLTVDMSEELPEEQAFNRPAGCYAVKFPLTALGYVYNDQMVYAEGWYDYLVRWGDTENAPGWYGSSFYNPQTGLFSLFVLYFDLTSDFGYAYGRDYEYCQLPGFPDYSLEVTYNGVFNEASGLQSYSFVQVTTGPDFDEVRVVNIAGDEVETAVASVLDESMEYQLAGPSESKEFRFPIGGPGNYTAIAVGMKNKEMVKLMTAEYTISSGGVVDNDRWKSIGDCLYVDGWVMPAYQDQDGVGLNPNDYPYIIDVQEDSENPGVYRMVNPYGIDVSPLGDLNGYDGFVYLTFNAQDDDFVYMEPQFSGYDIGEEDGQSGMMTITDLNGYYLSGGNEKGAILAYYQKQGYTMEDDWSFNDNGVIVLQPTLFNAWGLDGFYQWKAVFPSEVWFPGTFNASNVAARRIRTIANQGLRLNNPEMMPFFNGKKLNHLMPDVKYYGNNR